MDKKDKHSLSYQPKHPVTFCSSACDAHAQETLYQIVSIGLLGRLSLVDSTSGTTGALSQEFQIMSRKGRSLNRFQ